MAPTCYVEDQLYWRRRGGHVSIETLFGITREEMSISSSMSNEETFIPLLATFFS